VTDGGAWSIEPGRLLLGDCVYVSFQRTHLVMEPAAKPPPSYGAAPLARCPAGPIEGDVVVPIGLDEAFWLGFEGVNRNTRTAIRIRVEPGDIDAVTGDRWSEALSKDPQNYVVVPPQLSLHGVWANAKAARQFVRRVDRSGDWAPCSRLWISAVCFPTTSAPLHPQVRRVEPLRAERAGSSGLDDGPPRGPGIVPQITALDPGDVSDWTRLQHLRTNVSVSIVSPEDFEGLTGLVAPGPLDRLRIFQGRRLP
jgi:hypothetical protein